MRTLSIRACWCVLMVLAALYPHMSHAADTPPSCAVDYVAYGQGQLTPAVVTGSANSHLSLHQRHPLNDAIIYQPDIKPGSTYLISGDKVEIAARCGGYTYVRYESKKNVSLGWVDNSRIRTTGKPYEQPTIGDDAICRAATEVMDKHQWVQLPLRPIDPAVAAKANLDSYGSRATSLARISIDGRILTAVLVEDGGTEESNYVDIWAGNMSKHLSQYDRPTSDPISIESNGPNEGLVEVLGVPMIYQYAPDNPDKSYLSSIDKDGYVQPRCAGGPKRLAKPHIVFSTPNVTCNSFIDGLAVDVSMSPPTPAEGLSISRPPSGLEAEPARGPDSFRDSKDAVDVVYKLLSTGEADLDNSGHGRRIGIVSYEASSTAGDGWNGFIAAPIFLDAKGKADPTSPENKILFDGMVDIVKTDDSIPAGPATFSKVVRVDGKTYIEVSKKRAANPVDQVWRVDSSKPQKVCQYQSSRYEFSPFPSY
jgi:hypothetical protein